MPVPGSTTLSVPSSMNDDTGLMPLPESPNSSAVLPNMNDNNLMPLPDIPVYNSAPNMIDDTGLSASHYNAATSMNYGAAPSSSSDPYAAGPSTSSNMYVRNQPDATHADPTTFSSMNTYYSHEPAKNEENDPNRLNMQ
eukprot:420134_1